MNDPIVSLREVSGPNTRNKYDDEKGSQELTGVSQRIVSRGGGYSRYGLYRSDFAARVCRTVNITEKK